MPRSAAPIAALMVFAGLALTGCTPTPTPALDCATPVETDLGFARLDVPAWFTVSGGRIRFATDESRDGTLLEDADVVTVYVGDATSYPTPRSADDRRIANARLRVRIDAGHPGSLDLPAGSYWVVSGGGRLTMAACPGTTVSGVLPSDGATAAS